MDLVNLSMSLKSLELLKEKYINFNYLAFTTNSYNAPALTSIKFESKEACQNAAVFSQKQSVVGEVKIKAWCAK